MTVKATLLNTTALPTLSRLIPEDEDEATLSCAGYKPGDIITMTFDGKKATWSVTAVNGTSVRVRRNRGF